MGLGFSEKMEGKVGERMTGAEREAIFRSCLLSQEGPTEPAQYTTLIWTAGAILWLILRTNRTDNLLWGSKPAKAARGEEGGSFGNQRRRCEWLERQTWDILQAPRIHTSISEQGIWTIFWLPIGGLPPAAAAPLEGWLLRAILLPLSHECSVRLFATWGL